ncbi:MAG: hypothetical protein WC310_00210 [Patescibacteria group bacterium]|jgi:hypothetical protein
MKAKFFVFNGAPTDEQLKEFNKFINSIQLITASQSSAAIPVSFGKQAVRTYLTVFYEEKTQEKNNAN